MRCALDTETRPPLQQWIFPNIHIYVNSYIYIYLTVPERVRAILTGKELTAVVVGSSP